MLVCAADPAHHPLKGQGDWPGDFRCHVPDHPESCGIKDRHDRKQQSKQRHSDGYDIAREQSILRLSVVTVTPAGQRRNWTLPPVRTLAVRPGKTDLPTPP